MAMISVRDICGNQYSKARSLNSPVVVVDSGTFRVPSASRDERDHKVQLDDPENPRACSCTCEAGVMNRACWAMARVLEALETLRAANVYVSRGALSAWSGLTDAAGALLPPAQAGFVEGGDMALSWGGEPQSGVLYNIPN